MGKKATYTTFLYEGKKKREAVEVICNFCGKNFLKAKRFYKPGEKNFCCKQHQLNSLKKPKVKVICALCGKEFYRNPSSLKGSKSGLYFCNRKCKDKAQRIENGIPEICPPHYGKGKNLRSYRKVAFKKYKKECEICGYNEHFEVLQVHHIDSDRTNNDVLNLMVLCPTCHWSITLKYAIITNDRKYIWIGKKKK